MKAIMVMFDTLRRTMMPCFQPEDQKVPMPNFQRLISHSAVFDHHYVCSMPCIPARRELHTGRANFLHRSWGPLEPFDDSMPELLKKAGIHTHLSTDHHHYFADGGATYHPRYSTWEGFRGQVGDAWVGKCGTDESGFAPVMLNPEHQPEKLQAMRKPMGWQNLSNRTRRKGEAEYSQTLTFDGGISFIKNNLDEDRWFVQIECFDPHEPFDAPEEFLKPWFHEDFTYDWPPYAAVEESQEMIDQMRRKYYALAQFCDKSLGRILDLMDEFSLWKDTMLIVNTDHGFLLGEHDWWGKNFMPDYEEISHIPLFIWDPRCGVKGEHRMALSQNIDLAPTILQYFGVPIPEDMRGKPLKNTIESDVPVRKYGIFGIHGGPVNITDGRYVYMRAVRTPEARVWEYTLMPAHMKNMFGAEELQETELEPPLAFTKGCPVMKIPVKTGYGRKLAHDALFDLRNDPGQERPMHDEEKERELENALTALFLENDAPDYVYRRFGLDYIPGKREEAVHETDL